MAAEFGRRAKDRHGAGVTPFRYPGGKGFLADLLEQHIDKAKPEVTTYAEAYAGGAGAAIELLARGAVERVILNDFDRRVHAAWWAILNKTEEFIDRIYSTTVNMDAWYKARDLVQANDPVEDKFELGFAMYFLNRTNRSGVVLGAGPIGGYDQTGRWLIDARYYPDTMTRRIRWLGERRDRIDLHNCDGIQFLRQFGEEDGKRTFFFIDPPYVQAGAKLYLNAMNDLKHRDLARFLISNKLIKHWLVTYDDCQLISEAYGEALISRVPVRYSLHRKRTEHEVCVLPRDVG